MKLALPSSLLALSALLLAAIGYELLAPIGAIQVEAPRAPVLRAAAPISQIAPPSIDLYADMDARPLFNPKRTPLPDSGLAGPANGSPSDLVLVGVMIGGAKPLALLKSTSAATTTTATIGDMVGGWRVIDIAPTRVGLRGPSGLIEVPLASLGSQTPSAPLPAPAPAPADAAEPSPAPASAPPPAPTSASAQPSHIQPTPPVSAPKPSAIAPVSAAVTVSAKPALPARSGDGTIAAEALKGAPINPKTGEPTL